MPRARNAVFTMVRNESNFLDIWLSHYRRELPDADLVVLDHLSSDGSIEEAQRRHDFEVVRVTHPAYDDFPWYTSRIEREQRRLLESHEVVVFAESDELLWHEHGLQQFVSSFSRPAVRATGYQVIERPDDAPISRDMPLLMQRSTWFRDEMLDKALVSRIPLSYTPGFHVAEPATERDPGLLLVHLHTIDRRWAQEKKRRIVTYADYDEVTRASDLAVHNRLVDGEFDAWWADLDQKFELEPIPEQVRRSILV